MPPATAAPKARGWAFATLSKPPILPKTPLPLAPPIVFESFPNIGIAFPIACAPPPTIVIAGPAAAAKPTKATASVLTGPGIFPNASAAPFNTVASFSTMGTMMGISTSPIAINDDFRLAIACCSLNAVVPDVTSKALSNAPVVSSILLNIASVEAEFAPSISITPMRARTFPNTAAVAASFPANVSFRVPKVASKPSCLIWLRKPWADSPILARASLDCFVGFSNDVRIPRTWVAASLAFVPVLDSAANAAPTSSKETPIAEATGSTRPIDPASSVASNLPSRTAATITSVASEALNTSEPYALRAEVARSAIVAVSPNPTAAAFAEASSVSVASAPRIPAEVIKNIASASSLGALAVEPDRFLTSAVKPCTASAESPTKDSILVMLASKSAADLIANPPAATIGIVTDRVSFFPVSLVFLPKASNDFSADLSSVLRDLASALMIAFRTVVIAAISVSSF